MTRGEREKAEASIHVELDHIFICTDPGGDAAAKRLRGLGLSEGTGNVHPGQGTACRRFFFRSAYIELLWVDDEREARSALPASTHLWERWAGRERGACPFGIAFRPRKAENLSAPFRSWEYRPPYLPPGAAIHIAGNAHILEEPLLFHLPFGQRPDSFVPPRREPLEHACEANEITRATLGGAWPDRCSPQCEMLDVLGIGRVHDAAGFGLALGLDGEHRGQCMDCRPQLPLSLAW